MTNMMEDYQFYYHFDILLIFVTKLYHP